MGSLTVVMSRFSFVRETQGPNKGLWVNLFQRFTGNDSGDSWCCSFLCYCLDILFMGASPLKKSGRVQDIYDQCVARGYMVDTPHVDDIFFFIDVNGHAHHIGAVTGVTPALAGIAGNTSEDGTSSNGDGVHDHPLQVPRDRIKFARLPDAA